MVLHCTVVSDESPPKGCAIIAFTYFLQIAMDNTDLKENIEISKHNLNTDPIAIAL